MVQQGRGEVRNFSSGKEQKNSKPGGKVLTTLELIGALVISSSLGQNRLRRSWRVAKPTKRSLVSGPQYAQSIKLPGIFDALTG